MSTVNQKFCTIWKYHITQIIKKHGHEQIAILFEIIWKSSIQFSMFNFSILGEEREQICSDINKKSVDWIFGHFFTWVSLRHICHTALLIWPKEELSHFSAGLINFCVRKAFSAEYQIKNMCMMTRSGLGPNCSPLTFMKDWILY